MAEKPIRKLGTIGNEIRDFCKYQSAKTVMLTIIKNVVIVGTLSYLFYDSLYFVVLLIPINILLFLEDIRRIKKRESQKVLTEFQDMLSVISQDLQAGSSVENAFVHAEKEIIKIHDRKSLMLKELRKVIHGLSVNIPIEKLMLSMAEKIREDEVETFAVVFAGAKRSGGNMIDIISFTVSTLIEKIRIKRETNMLISSKKLEQNIMSVIPMVILLYVKICCEGFIESLYHNFSGVLIMSVFLIIYVIAYTWSKSIMNIEV